MQGNLIILRKENGDTQGRMAELLGIDEGTYRMKELGHSQFKLQEMFDIADYYGKRIEDIFLPRKTTNCGD